MRGRVKVQQLTVVVLPLLALEFWHRQLSPIRLWFCKLLRALYMVKRQYENYSCPGLFSALITSNFDNSNLSRLNPCNTTGITLHVSTNSQHVSFIMLAKSNHVATVVASFDLLVGVVFVLTLQCPYQWDEGFECSLPQLSNFAKVDWQDSIKPGLNWFFQNET